uniref:UDP-xylose and UDP-N-acetylglucosamine transporter n=1 Tax=Glossina palpalis gambiensis TaxID=67801 RepID=A0A1B0B9Y2_9MUSC
MNFKTWSAVAGVFIGCCSNVIFLELLIKYDPGSGNLITFSQFLIIAIEGFIFTSKFGKVKPVIGLRDYGILVLMFFLTNVCNNYAFNFNIPMPLHMVFRAGSLMANMLMGIAILKRRYVISKYLSVLLITVGIVMCTLVSANEVEDTSNPKLKSTAAKNEEYSAIFWWTLGIIILTIALLISACMGIYQEFLYRKYGKRSREALYYTVILFDFKKKIFSKISYSSPLPNMQNFYILLNVGLTVGFLTKHFTQSAESICIKKRQFNKSFRFRNGFYSILGFFAGEIHPFSLQSCTRR